MSDILHLFWQPEKTDDFWQAGEFYFWIETSQLVEVKSPNEHPRQLGGQRLAEWLDTTLGQHAIEPSRFESIELMLPSSDGIALPCPELLSGTLEERPEIAEWKAWRVDCCRIMDAPIHTINALHYQLLFTGEVRPGQDFLFWYYYTQTLRQILLKDQYLPVMHCRQGEKKKSHELHAAWAYQSDTYAHLLKEAAQCMPPSAAPGFEATQVLPHCAEVLLMRAAGQAKLTQAFQKKIERTFLQSVSNPKRYNPHYAGVDSTLGGQWAGWLQRITGNAGERLFQLAFKLDEPTSQRPEHWRLEFLVCSPRDASLQTPLADYWAMENPELRDDLKPFGTRFEAALLTGLGQAATIYSPLWEALDTNQPTGMLLDLESAFAFLNETAWVLVDAGFRVILPSWWTPQGRRRASLRMRSSPSGKKVVGAAKNKSLSLNQLLEYRYDLMLGGETVAPEEWAQLVEAKTPLVQFRGQWVLLDKERMAEMLSFWKQQGVTGETAGLQALLQRTQDDDGRFEVDPEDALAEILAKLRDQSRLEPIENPPGLKAELREYQKRGVAWLAYLESLGLCGCLADDMGLGKTIQVIARLLHEQAQADRPPPTLLIAPTSVLGNWRKEMERFAPQLHTMIHHGTDRCRDAQAFAEQALAHDVVIVSYSLALRDLALLSPLSWHRIVLDEAQIIKNPEAQQTKAILKLNARSRLALTGTPVENRLLDLWSIFNFLNPGYLGKQAGFRKNYETPIQRDHDAGKSAQLKRLIEPFILRRIKTDPSIIKDLPDKVENKQYCNLSLEQASLYEAVVRDVEQQLEQSDGIQRQGLMLSTLMKLKQICNHPAQFLQDNSAFEAARSHKLERLSDMLAEVQAEGESALIFTQFTEIGSQLERYIKSTQGFETYYLHGGTSRSKREKMIARFQDPESPPAVFVLSLKAGGVGITLTRANHVFHFDRWWNPAVEDQATDRAFRIGQTRNVFVHKFLTLGTLEERLDEIIEDKKKVAGAIVGSDESWLAQLDNESFKQLIALNHSATLGE